MSNIFDRMIVAEPEAVAVSNGPAVLTLDTTNDYTQRYTSGAPITLESLRDHAAALRAARQDRTVEVRALNFYPDSDGDAVRVKTIYEPSAIERGESYVDFGLNENAVDQVYDFFSTSHDAPTGRYLAQWDAQTRAELLNRHVDKHVANRHVRKSWLLRGLNGVARAALSTSYTTIENDELIEKYLEAVYGQDLPDFRLTGNTFVSPDRMRIDAIWRNAPEALRDSNGGGYGTGITMRNDLVGRGSYSLYALVKRHSCDNSIVIDPAESRIKISHSGKTARAAAIGTIFDYMHALIEKSGHAVVALYKAERTPVEVPNWSALFDSIYADLGLTDTEKETAIIGTEGKRTVGGIINAVTYAAHQTPKITDERAFELQYAAGKLLFDQDKVAAQAKRVAEVFSR